MGNSQNTASKPATAQSAGVTANTQRLRSAAGIARAYRGTAPRAPGHCAGAIRPTPLDKAQNATTAERKRHPRSPDAHFVAATSNAIIAGMKRVVETWSVKTPNHDIGLRR